MGYYVKGKKNIQKIELTWKGWYDGIWGHKFACSRDLLKFYDVLFYVLWYYYYVVLWYLDILMVYQYLYKIQIQGMGPRVLIGFEVYESQQINSLLYFKVFKKFLRYFNLDSLQNTGLNMPHTACLGTYEPWMGQFFLQSIL